MSEIYLFSLWKRSVVVKRFFHYCVRMTFRSRTSLVWSLLLVWHVACRFAQLLQFLRFFWCVTVRFFNCMKPHRYDKKIFCNLWWYCRCSSSSTTKYFVKCMEWCGVGRETRFQEWVVTYFYFRICLQKLSRKMQL